MDTVTFGSYIQSDVKGKTKEPIEWVVLEKQEDRALLLSKYILDKKSYNDVEGNITWEKSSLRNWLNSYFYNKAFNVNEKNYIINSEIINSNNIENNLNSPRGEYNLNVDGGKNTKDNVFILSKDEVLQYFGYVERDDGPIVCYDMYNNILCKGTNYVGKYRHESPRGIEDMYERDWWTRTPGINQEYCLIVDYSGGLIVNGRLHKDENGVRPAIWVTLK